MPRTLPTARADWQRMVAATVGVARRPRSALVALGVAALALTAFTLAQQWEFALDVLTLPGLTARERALVLLDRYPLVGSAFGPVRGSLLALVALEIGVTAALVVRRVLTGGLPAGRGVAGSLGVVLGGLGAGCAACGSTVLVGLLSAVGVTGAVALLPFDGKGLLALGALTMLVSLHHVSRAPDDACDALID